MISRRYFKNLRSLSRMAMARLVGDEEADTEESQSPTTQAEDEIERKVPVGMYRP